MNRTVPVLFVHVFYADVWAEMAAEIAASFDRPFEVVVTCPNPALDIATVDSPHLVRQRRIDVENRGRDVLPFVRALREVGPNFEIGLKLHTKRSKHRDDGEAWRQHLTGTLLSHADGEHEPAALALMEAEPRIGLVAPAHHMLSLESRVGLNARALRRVADTLKMPLDLDALEADHFAASSMFWFRRSAFDPLLTPRLDALFEREKGQLDGTTAHALERLFARLAEEKGLIATAAEAVPALTRAVREGASTEALQALARSELRPLDNPFILPVPELWRRHPRLMLVAHHLYHHLPRPLFVVARLGFRILMRRERSAGRS
ncbi:rhamnan synthesis F family protein [Aureimonas ureilytica]|uniref:rhamnan synthesis F family protein n=1 Tax=Aureimonas ureilytica TaxID=401562 RepID=UPI0003826EA6|nr:rhamnan synthesis F family protein [Aureimonas ureilytica]